MSKHYDEKKVLNQLSKKFIKVDYSLHRLLVPKDIITIGIHTWGKIDYLCHYCGWSYVMDNLSAAVRQKIIDRQSKE